MALGFDQEPHAYLEKVGLTQGKWGEIVIDPLTGQTAHSKIYAGGDCHLGADLVVTAAAEGRRAAMAMISRFLD
jgi:glutamate synthase (NADPH/NADH) small chain